MHLEETELSLFAYDMITHIRGGQPFSLKNQVVSGLGFADHRSLSQEFSFAILG